MAEWCLDCGGVDSHLCPRCRPRWPYKRGKDFLRATLDLAHEEALRIETERVGDTILHDLAALGLRYEEAEREATRLREALTRLVTADRKYDAAVLNFDIDATAYAALVAEHDAALAHVAAHAEQARRDFARDAQAAILELLGMWERATFEQLVDGCMARGIRPHDAMAFGPVFMRLLRRGLIRRVGSAPRAKGHGCSGGNVWEIAS